MMVVLNDFLANEMNTWAYISYHDEKEYKPGDIVEAKEIIEMKEAVEQWLND